MCSHQISIILVVAMTQFCLVHSIGRQQEGIEFVDSFSPFCRSFEGQKLVCDYNSTTKSVILGAASRRKRSAESSYKSVEIRSASVFHLAESACLEDISIRDTKRVIVDDSYQKKKETEFCAEYQLSILNSTITNIPVTVTRLDVIRSTIENLITPPPLARASVLHSKVGVFSTNLPLNGSSFVNISHTTIGEVRELKMQDKARILISSSNLTFKSTDGLSFKDNVSVIISKSSLSPREAELLIGPDVEVTLSEVKGEVKIKVLRIFAESTKSFSIHELDGSKAGRLSSAGDIHTSGNNMIFLYIVLAAAVSIVLTLVIQKMWYRIQKMKLGHNEGQGEVSQKENANGKRISSCSTSSSDSGIDREGRVPILLSKTPETSPNVTQSDGSSIKRRQTANTPAAKKQLYV